MPKSSPKGHDHAYSSLWGRHFGDAEMVHHELTALHWRKPIQRCGPAALQASASSLRRGRVAMGSLWCVTRQIGVYGKEGRRAAQRFHADRQPTRLCRGFPRGATAISSTGNQRPGSPCSPFHLTRLELAQSPSIRRSGASQQPLRSDPVNSPKTGKTQRVWKCPIPHRHQRTVELTQARCPG